MNEILGWRLPGIVRSAKPVFRRLPGQPAAEQMPQNANFVIKSIGFEVPGFATKPSRAHSKGWSGGPRKFIFY